MPNLERKISAHNKSSLVNNSQSQEKSCNCRDKHSCPLGGDCLIQNVVYQATVVSPMGKETYIGLTANQFKTRFRNHTAPFRDESKRNATELSKHIWSLKDAKTEFTVTWKIMARARPYSMQPLHNRKIFHHLQTGSRHPEQKERTGECVPTHS